MVPKLFHAEDEFAFPSTLAQQRFWFLDRLNPGDPAYNIAVRWRLLGKLNPSLLERAFNEVVRRHEVLRTRIVADDGVPLQVIVSDFPIRMPVIDLRLLPEAQRTSEAERVTLDAARRSFDLARLPLIRTCLLRLTDEESTVLVTVHHIVADGWSIGHIAREMCRLYEAFVRGGPSPLQELPVQYGDFAVWQAEWVKNVAFERHAAYWKQHLRGVVPFELPADHPRPEVQTSNGTIVSRLLPRQLTDGLREYSQRQECTFFVTAVSAFLVLLHRYTGREDIAVTTQVAGRGLLELEDLVGCFINTVVLRADLSGDPLFGDFTRRVRGVVMDALAHQEMPFELLADALKLKRDLSRKAVFQVNFIYQRAFVENTGFDGIKLIDLPSRSPGALYDLNVFMVERVDGWRLSCEFNTDLYEPATITRLLGHLQNLFQRVVENPQRRVSELPLLTEADRIEHIDPWNQTAADYPRDRELHQLFEAQVERTPNAVAVMCGGRSLTYRELNARANQLARRLAGCGAGPNELVGICIDRSVEMLVGLLGILKTGAAYVPLDPAYPPARLQSIREDAGFRILVTQERLAVLVPNQGGVTLCIDRDWREISHQSSRNPNVATAAESTAYVIFTSGSTGRPKGVAISHRALVNLLWSMRQTPGLSSSDRLLAVTTLSFDIAALELFLPLLVGAQVVVAGRETCRDGARLRKLLEDSRATVLQATPSTWRLLLEAGWRSDPGLKMLCGGEALKRDLAERLLEHGGELWNMYGPTETTIWSSVCRLERGTGDVFIGRPIANTQFHVLDGRLQPVPLGVPGELHIGGDGLALGYYNLPEVTAARFIANPFAPATRLYKTGDLVRQRDGGNYEFLGRIDHQVKIRGFRIELEEIESVLKQHPAVDQAIVVAREVGADDRRLVAYAASSTSQIEGELHDLLREKLPDYMQPSAICVVAALPLTANGKVDRSLLPEPDFSAGSKPFVAPRNERERQLCELWEQLLGVHPVGVQDKFFDLGGHSLLAARLFAMIQQVFGRNLPLATLFEAPTVERLAEVLEKEDKAEKWSTVVCLQRRGSNPPLYIISGLGGNVVRFQNLAQHLGQDQPVYALQPPGLDGMQPFLTSVEEMARHYIRAIRAVQPEGPYHLAGYSFGGLVAFEMARQLSTEPASVALLALLDTPEWGYARSVARSGLADRFWGAFHRRFQQIVFGPNRIEYLKSGLWRRLSHLLYRVNRAVGRPIPQTYGTIQDINSFAASVYVARPYTGRVTLLRTMPRHRRPGEDYLLGWGSLGQGGVEVHEIPGTHDDITTDPNAGVLAATLAECVHRSQAGEVVVEAIRSRGIASPTTEKAATVSG